MDLRNIHLPDCFDYSVIVFAVVNLEHSLRKLCALLSGLLIVELVCHALYWAMPRGFCQ